MKTLYNPNSKSLYKESIQKLFISSLSFPTFLAQSMGYLPLSFNKSTNCLRLKPLSIPMLTLIFHTCFNLSYMTYYFIHLDTFALIVGAKSPSSPNKTSCTMMYLNLGNMILGTGATFLIRMSCVFKSKDIISFYDQLKSTLSNVLLNSPLSLKELSLWKSKINKELSPVWTTTFVAFLFALYTFVVISYLFHVTTLANVDDNQTLLWKWFGVLAVVACSIATALYSALLIWLSSIVGLIRLGFNALEQSFVPINNKLINVHNIFWTSKLANHNKAAILNGPPTDPQEYFLSQFLELKELVQSINCIFSIPIIISLGGLMGFWIFYGFLSITVYGSDLPFLALLVGSSAMGSMILLCFANFWSFCNTSQKLHEQVRI